jgi:cystathionine gamma-synthase
MLKQETRLVQPAQRSLAPLLDRSTAFGYINGERGDFYYQRHGHPAGVTAESLLGELDGGHALLFPSGMAAITSVFLALLQPGDRVAIAKDTYYGVSRLVSEVLRPWGLRVIEFDPTADLPDDVQLYWLETPSSALLTFPDVSAIVAFAHERGALVAVDATVATPVLFRPIEYGADITVHSATKTLSGHSDVLLGVTVCRTQDFADRLERFRSYTGIVAAPDLAWFLLRGLRTLAVRIERQCASAQTLADRLAAHPAVTAVHYPGLGNDLARRYLSAFGGLVSFEIMGGVETAQAVERATRVFVNATSFGGCESLIEARYRWESGRMPPTLVRLSVGLEHVDDLWEDLEQALDVIGCTGAGLRDGAREETVARSAADA